MDTIKTGAEQIAAERQRQITVEGYSTAHDDLHRDGSLGIAAECYASTVKLQVENSLQKLPPCFIHKGWPWGRSDWKASADPIKNLVKAGALYQAEIDRCTRLRAAMHTDFAKEAATEAIKRMTVARDEVAAFIDRLQKPLAQS